MPPKIYFLSYLSSPTVIWNPNYSTLLHSQKDFLTAKPITLPHFLSWSLSKGQSCWLSFFPESRLPGLWDTALTWSTFLSSSCSGSLHLWSSLSIILCSYLSLSQSCYYFLHTTGNLCFLASPGHHSPTYNALILATSQGSEVVLTSEVLLWWLTAIAFPPAPKLPLANPDHVALIMYCIVTTLYFFIVVKLFVEINHISPTKYNLEIRDIFFNAPKSTKNCTM